MLSHRASPVVIRIAAAIVIIAATFAFAGRIAAFAAEPVIATYRTGEACRQLEAELRQEAAVNSRLLRDIGYLNTEAGIEQEARKRGYVRPGEIAMTVVVPLPRGADALPERKAIPMQTAAANTTVSDRIRSAVDTCLAVFGSSRPPTN